MEREMTDTTEMGIEAVIGAVFLFACVTFFVFGRQWYSAEIQHENNKSDMAKTASEYAMLSRESVTGAEIIEYILRYGSIYDYTIYTGGVPYRLTKAAARAQNKYNLWSEKYLSEVVFADRLTQQYTVEPVYSNEEVYAFIFTKITETEGGGD